MPFQLASLHVISVGAATNFSIPVAGMRHKKLRTQLHFYSHSISPSMTKELAWYCLKGFLMESEIFQEAIHV